jgi:hypothetical protein
MLWCLYSPRRAAYLDHQRAVEGAAQRLGDAARDGILSHVDTERRPHDAAVRDDLTDDAAHRVHGDGEPDPDVAGKPLCG